MADLIFHGQFIDKTNLDGETGLTVTIDVYRTLIADGTTSQVVTGGSCTETGGGIYRYRYASADLSLYHYVANMMTASADVAQKHVAALGLVVPDALVGSRLAPAVAGRTLAVAATGEASANVTYWAGVAATAGAIPAAVAGATGGVAIVGSEMGLADSAITSAKLESDAVAEIWSYTTRTLTQSSTSTTDSTAAGSISRRRGDSWLISLTLGAITGYTALWFTVKAATSDPDTAAIFQIKKNASGSGDGLLYVNGATASSAALGSITVSDATTGAVIIALDETITDDLTPASYVYDCQALISGSVSTPDSGTFTVTADVTRVVA